MQLLIAILGKKLPPTLLKMMDNTDLCPYFLSKETSKHFGE
ncbi:hypothetical protein [Flammeovirga aprica]|nr:hypothetical protein [Flammeovirga aprica]